jgi:hypothetical protein
VASSTISIEIPGDGTYAVPFEAVALDRASYMARQATGAGPGNNLYDEVLENETQFALGHPNVLQDWARTHMRRAALSPYRVPD